MESYCIETPTNICNLQFLRHGPSEEVLIEGYMLHTLQRITIQQYHLTYRGYEAYLKRRLKGRLHP